MRQADREKSRVDDENSVFIIYSRKIFLRLRALFQYDLRAGITQNSLLLLSGNLAGMALGLISSALLARSLGPEGLRIFAVIGTVTTIGHTVADFGLSSSAIRQIAVHLTRDPDQARRTAGIFARLKLLTGLITCGFILAFVGPLTRVLKLPPESGPLLIALTSLMLLVSVLHGMTGTILQALRRYRLLVGTQLVNAGSTVLLVALFFLTQRLTLWPALILVGVVTTLAATSLEFSGLPADWRKAVLSRAEHLGTQGRRLLGFSKWLWLSASLSILASQLDLLLVNLWTSPQIAGFYALALNLSFKVHIVNKALYVVLLPTVSALAGQESYRTYVRHSLARSLILGALVLAMLPLAPPFILAVYGTAYAASINVFYFLMAFVLVDLFSMPVLLLAFPMNRPRLIAASDAVRVVTLIVAGSLFIPVWGMYGAALAKLISVVAGALVTGTAIALGLRTSPPTPTPSLAVQAQERGEEWPSGWGEA